MKKITISFFAFWLAAVSFVPQTALARTSYFGLSGLTVPLIAPPVPASKPATFAPVAVWEGWWGTIKKVLEHMRDAIRDPLASIFGKTSVSGHTKH